MRQIIGYLFVSLATFVIGVTATTPWTYFGFTPDSRAKQEILRVEREYLNAYVERDTAALERILAEDFTISGYWGAFENKAERLALVSDPDRIFRSIDTSDVEVTVKGDTAYVTGQAVIYGSYRGRIFRRSPYSFTRTYEKRDGRWQVVSVRCGRYSLR